MTVIELSLCEEDRKTLGGPEWVRLDVDRVFDTPASMLERWETETGYPIERAIAEAGGFPPAKATRILVWLARKQNPAECDAFDDQGKPEPFTRLADVKTMKVRLRRAQMEIDAVPPAGSAEPTSAD